jgi:hypothetical protein
LPSLVPIGPVVSEELQNQIFTLVAARPTFVYVVRCVVSTVLNTALWPLDLCVFKFSLTEEEIHFFTVVFVIFNQVL